MSLRDFERCTPSEFKAVWEAWQGREQRRERTSWEQTRLLCTTLLQPYSKKALRVRDVMEFPWDTDVAPEEAPAAPKQPTREEEMERYRQAIRRAGLK